MESTTAIVLLITFGLIVPIVLISVMLLFIKYKNKKHKDIDEQKKETENEMEQNNKTIEKFGCFSIVLFGMSIIYSVVVFIKDGFFGDLYTLFNLKYPNTDYIGFNKILDFFFDMPLLFLIIIVFLFFGLAFYAEHREIEEKYKKIN